MTTSRDRFWELTIQERRLVNRMYIGAISAIEDPLGHFPNCTYTDEKPTCACMKAGEKIHAAIVKAFSRKKQGV